MKETIDRAFAEVFGLCDGSRRWTMSIPTRNDDSDIVICEGLRAGMEAVAERDALRAAGEAPYAVVMRCGQLEAQAVTLIAERDALRAQVAQLRAAALFVRGELGSEELREVLSAALAATGTEAPDA